MPAAQMLWEPPNVKQTQMYAFKKHIEWNYNVSLDGYAALHQWSIDNIPQFWEEVWEWTDRPVVASRKWDKIPTAHSGRPPRSVGVDHVGKRYLVNALLMNNVAATDDMMHHISFNMVIVIDLTVPMQAIPAWFEGARLNWAENMLRPEFRTSGKVALIQVVEPEPAAPLSYTQLSYASLYSIVHSTSLALSARGIQAGDILGYYGPTSLASVVFCLAATSLGAIWSSAASDFGSKGVLERFEQFGDKLFGIVCVDGVRYNGKRIDQRKKVNEVLEGLQKNRGGRALPVILVDYLQEGLPEPIEEGWMSESMLRSEGEELKSKAAMDFYQTSFDHPLWVLFSSGTTGKPKPIVHRSGGMLLQSKKEHIIHGDLSENDVFFYYTTPGWMMYNYLISGLQTGATVIVYDGSPLWKPELLWRMADELAVTIFGTSAKYIDVLSKGYAPNQHFKLAALRQVLSTGSPLKPESFVWVYENIKKDILLGSITGGELSAMVWLVSLVSGVDDCGLKTGTDICSLFAGHNAMLPVYEGEIQSLGLGMAVESYSEDGKSLPRGKQGELVCTKPFPCMPVYFWNDEGNARYHASYFDKFEGVWAHGDFCIITPSQKGNGGGLLMLGRSDGVGNPSGVRFGSSEIYEVMDTFPSSIILDALVVGQKTQGSADERVLLFVKVASGQVLTNELVKEIKLKIRSARSARHVPERIIEVKDVPYTINGKKVEIPIKKLLSGAPLNSINFATLSNPECLEEYVQLGQKLRAEVA
ncbi:BQ2448_1560 [Microbotryum intermedium]|uniref:BQ2448_1560 protein n=1 Tax=Microbotryum intermedium TaxID=269621 RepID=A0A238FGJ4_9BASI|nr:BQ2448_1560 [Microbotryum intermedium]